MFSYNQKSRVDMFKKNTTSLFLASAVFVVSCIVYVYIFLISARDEVRRLNAWVDHSKIVISQVYITMTEQEAVLADQRGYLLTGDSRFLTQFKNNQDDLLISVRKLVELTNDNPEQNRKADEIHDFSLQYVSYLTERKDAYKDMYRSYDQTQLDRFISGLDTVDLLHERLSSLIFSFLEKENLILKERISAANEKRAEYGQNMVLSLFGACALIMLMNWVLFQEQKKFFLDSERLRNIDDRHKLAIKAVNDGIFDWDIGNKTIFLSSQIFKMCGYDKNDYDGPLIGLAAYMDGLNLLDLIHPDDITAFKQNLDHFVNGLTSEYTNIFRVKHANGYWIWVCARGGGIFGSAGKPIKLIGSHSDITAQKQMEERLKKEMEEAEGSSKAKMEFLAHMSHEIRTPLTTVSGIAEILERQSNKFDEKQNSLIKTLITSTTTLKDLINDVLDFSRIDSGEITLEKNKIQLDTLLAEVVSIMSVQAIEKNIEFKADHSNIAHLVFEGDQIRLRQILINLVGNAIKFTEKGGVSILSKLDCFVPENASAVLSIKVIDTGIGISPLYHEIIFDKFKQVDDTISKRFGGTGLGLPISRSLAQMMGGALTVDSKVGEGSTFALEIPIKILNPDEVVENKILEKRRYAGHIEANLKSLKPDDDQKVLMVEDYEGNVVVIGYILDEFGIKYDVARNGIEALDKFKNDRYKVILMDLQMPKMDGLTATLKIRELEKQLNLPVTPIIGMTAHATFKDKNNCIESGMNDFISKPIDQSNLVNSLMKYLKEVL